MAAYDSGSIAGGVRHLGKAMLVILAAGTTAVTGAAIADESAGTITVGDRSWELVPSIQCGVYPGPMIAIAGHAAGNADIEITIDYDPSSGLVEAKVTGGDEGLDLSARDDDLSVAVDGRTVSGNGAFRSGWGGGPATDGSFEVKC